MRLDELDWREDGYPSGKLTAIIPYSGDHYWINHYTTTGWYEIFGGDSKLHWLGKLLRWVKPNPGPIRTIYKGYDVVAVQCIVYDLIQKHKGAD